MWSVAWRKVWTVVGSSGGMTGGSIILECVGVPGTVGGEVNGIKGGQLQNVIRPELMVKGMVIEGLGLRDCVPVVP